MPAREARDLLVALADHGVTASVGGGWAVDALVGEQSREHSDLDLWLPASDLEGLFVAFTALGLDRIHPWPGDRPWNFVLHDGLSRRVDLHLYEGLGVGKLHYGSVVSPFVFAVDDLSGHGEIGGCAVSCELPAFALANRSGYPPRDVDRHDVALLCERFGLEVPDGYRGSEAGPSTGPGRIRGT
jgi:lincosamide nucleotidyltransferase A/C/D/E